MSTQPEGLYHKFEVRRVDGRDQPGGDRAGAEYIVLDLTHCPFSRTAALAYANKMAPEYPQAAADIRTKVARLPPFPLKPYQQRVVEEKAELDDRTVKLGAFTATPAFARLDDDEKGRLLDQLDLMTKYARVLARRIANFNT